jgi:hypothetical protein
MVYSTILAAPLSAAAQTTSAVLTLPFDIAREMYAKSVRTGLIKDSLIACARYSRDLNATEKLTLGPWARDV